VDNRFYKVGYYCSKQKHEILMRAGNRRTEKIGDLYVVYQDELTPMSHEQALVFRSKMMDQNNHFLYEVAQ
jgi:hypothetical protein